MKKEQAVARKKLDLTLSTETLKRLAVETGLKAGHVQTDNPKWATCVDCNRR